MNMNRVILILESESYSREALEVYNKLGRVEHYGQDKKSYHDNEVFVLVVRLAHFLGEEFLSPFEALDYIVTPTTGLNHIDMEYCRRRGIKILSLKGEVGFLEKVTSTSELAFGLILALVRDLCNACDSVLKHGSWNRNLFRGRELSGMCLGIIGLGRLGKQMVSYCQPFALEILAHDPYVKPEAFEEAGVKSCSKRELFSGCDIVSVHADYRSEYGYIVGMEEFSCMKPGSYFVNTARGELVDEDALIDALECGQLSGAALDVLSFEHSDEFWDKPIIRYAQGHSNLIITPHIGGCTRESMEKTELFMAQRAIEIISQEGGRCE